MPEITVVMPSLNVARFMEKCLKSVMNQTFRDIEILVIDAGSTDGTVDIIKECASHDDRIRLIHSEKKSYGYQMNLGISMARGKYLSIVETDDYILDDMLNDLYIIAEKNQLDYAKADNYSFFELQSGDIYKSRRKIVNSSLYNIVLNPSEHRKIHISDIFIWNGIYNMSFINEHGIKFNESAGAAYQDAGFLFQTIGYAQKVMYIDKAYYYYRQDNGGSSMYNPNGFRYLANEYDYIYDKLRGTEIWNGIEHFYYVRMFLQCSYRIKTMTACGKQWNEFEENVQHIREKLKTAVDNYRIDEFSIDFNTWMELNYFLNYTDKYINSYMDRYEIKRKMLNDFYSMVQKHDNIVFYSCSNLGKYVYGLIEAKKLEKEIVFCDNNVEKQGTVFCGKQVLSCEKACDLYNNSLYIIANNHYSRDMLLQLLRAGIDRKDIYQYRMDCELLNFML